MRSTTSSPSSAAQAHERGDVEPVVEARRAALGLVVVPEDVGRHDRDAAGAHEPQALPPLRRAAPAVVHLARHGITGPPSTSTYRFVSATRSCRSTALPIAGRGEGRSRGRWVTERHVRRCDVHGVWLLLLCALPVLTTGAAATARAGTAPRDRLGRMTQPLLDLAPRPHDADVMYDVFVDWADDRGSLHTPAQDEAIIEIVSGANVMLSTPTGTGKSLVALAAHGPRIADRDAGRPGAAPPPRPSRRS